MSEKPTEILARLVKLVNDLPSDPAKYTDLSAPKRQAIRTELEAMVSRLSDLAQSLNTIQQPKYIFDPTSPEVIGEAVARALLLREKEPLANATRQPFYGAGVYAIYYHGPFACYAPIAGKDHPIYVGKADPETLHALTPVAQGPRLHRRLKDHCRSISYAHNLKLEDFDCRYLVVRSAWVETAEDLLIGRFRPVWNNEIKVCYGFGKHGDSADTRKNERSPWDTLHPGRPWAGPGGNTPNKRNVEQICSAIAEHYHNFPPGTCRA